MTDKHVARFWAKVQKQDGDACWLWLAGKVSTGYGTFRWVNDSGNRVIGRAHRCSWEIHNGPIPEGICVLHHCDVPACVRPEHLWLGTKADNNRDKNAKGRGASLKTHGPDIYRRAAKGEKNGNAKLTDENVREIRALMASGMNQLSVARQFGVTHECIRQIVRGERWRHLT